MEQRSLQVEIRCFPHFVVYDLAENNALQKYHLLCAMQGHVLAALGRHDEAKAAFSAALECTCTLPEKRFLQRQLAMLSIERHSS
jgi:predicted RNA polymerase sigma factor